VHNLTHEQLLALDRACERELEGMGLFESGRESLALARDKVREAIRTME
jgi:exonuclease VII small subunit